MPDTAVTTPPSPESPSPAPQPPPLWRDPVLLAWARWCAILAWAVAFGHECYANGFPFDREGLLLWIMFGAAAVTIGKRAIWTVIVDFLPFGAVLVAYDYMRGVSDKLGMPTWWQPQVDFDKFLFGGVEPTVWLQEHLKYGKPQWWEALITLTYISFFFMPYVTAGVLWIRSRAEYRRWAFRFVTLSFVAFAFYALTPAAPPWAAAQCSSADVAHHPANPSCMYTSAQYANGGILGKVTGQLHGGNPWVEHTSGRGFEFLHISVASSVLSEGQAAADYVAAVPSLHAAGTMLFVLFFWRRSRKWVRALMVLYPLAMGFTLVFTAEHYISDVLEGWLCAVAVMFAFDRLERRRMRAKATDTLDGPVPADPVTS